MTVHVLGNATLDLTYRVSRFPAPGETCLCSARYIGPGGKGLNQAVAAARAGVMVALSAPLGRDSAAEQLKMALAKEPRLRLYDWVRDELPSDESSIWVADDGENVIVSTAACAQSVQPDEIEAVVRRAEIGDVLALQGNLTEQTTLAALAAGKAVGLKTVLNPAPVGFAMSSLRGKVDVLVVNRVEAEAFGIEPSPSALANFARHFGGAVVVTLGGDAVVFAQPCGTIGSQKVDAVEPVDTTGAGDAFVGALCAALEQRMALDKAVARGVQAARQVVLTLGALTTAIADETLPQT